MNTYLTLAFLCCFVWYAFAGGYEHDEHDEDDEGPRKCKSGVIGPSCRKFGYGRWDCKPGYKCIDRKCCRLPVCPDGMKEGGSCYLLPGQQRCPFGYDCMSNNFCCQSRLPPPPPPSCPVLPAFVPDYCRWDKRPHTCTTDTHCKYGLLCCRDLCSIRGCTKPL